MLNKVSGKIHDFLSSCAQKCVSVGRILGRPVVWIKNGIAGLLGRVNKVFHGNVFKGKASAKAEAKAPAEANQGEAEAAVKAIGKKAAKEAAAAALAKKQEKGMSDGLEGMGNMFSAAEAETKAADKAKVADKRMDEGLEGMRNMFAQAESKSWADWTKDGYTKTTSAVSSTASSLWSGVTSGVKKIQLSITGPKKDENEAETKDVKVLML